MLLSPRLGLLLLMAVMMLLGLALSNASRGSETGSLSYLALGDSYTIGRSAPEEGRWPVQLAASLRDSGHRVNTPSILARSGWTSQQLLSAMGSDINNQKFDLISVLIGVNNQYQDLNIDTYREDLRKIFKRAIVASKRGAPGVFVLSIPDYGATPFGIADADVISPSIDQWNLVYQSVAKEFGLRFYDITGISRLAAEQKDLISFDRLHPSTKMYRLWVDAITGDVARSLKD